MEDDEFWPLTESKPMSRLQQNSAHLITSMSGPHKPNFVQFHPLAASGLCAEYDNSNLQFKFQLPTSDSTQITAGGPKVQIEGFVPVDGP